MTNSAAGPPQDRVPPIQLLLVEDSESRTARIVGLLAGADAARFELVTAADPEAARAALRDRRFDAVLLDATRLGRAGLEALLADGDAAPPLVVVSDDDALALDALRAGAQDHLLFAELDGHALARALRYAVERQRARPGFGRVPGREGLPVRHDSLTGLPNRLALQEHLAAALADAERRSAQLAVLSVDLDNFKAINDTLGHAAGDSALKLVAERLRAASGGRLLTARLGGDEFVVVVGNASDVYALASLIQSIQTELARPLRLAGRECWVTVSIGIAVFPHDGRDAEPLLHSADTAKTHAKTQGRNQFHFYEDGMARGSAERFQLVNNLHQAIARDQLVLHYQPQVDVGLRAIVGAEALVRWRHPTRGLVSPGDFIAVAEETGMIMPIGEWVLRAACADLLRWRLDPRSSFRLSVNVSSRQLAQHGFSQEVACILTEMGLGPGRLEIEITETGVVNADLATQSTLDHLRRLGVTVAMDDFGTGYSSLSLLRELSVDRIKIDQSFVRGAGEPGPDRVIVGGLIRMARGLRIETIAEGVETREQLQALFGEGCHLMQGYLFGKPVPADEFTALLTASELPWEAEIDAAGLDL